MKYSFILQFDNISNDEINELGKILIHNNIKYHVLKSDMELKENQKYKEVINKAIKYYLPIVGACALWFLICIGILAG